MAKYPLEALLTARLFREENAKREARKAVAALEEAREAARAAREELERYRQWRPGEEARLFEAIRGQELPLAEIDNHLADIQALRAAELAREEECANADKAVIAAEAEVEKAKQRQLDAIRARNKIEEHRNRWLEGERRRLEAAEEAELEEFSGLSGSSEDGDWFGEPEDMEAGEGYGRF